MTPCYTRLQSALIGKEQMRESSLYQEIFEEGRVETQRAYILEVLRTKFGAPLVAEWSAALATISDSARLDQLFRTALECANRDEFRRALTESQLTHSPTR
jgi:hypothetical protein